MTFRRCAARQIVDRAHSVSAVVIAVFCFITGTLENALVRTTRETIPSISPISTGGFLRLKENKAKLPVGVIVKFSFFSPVEKLEEGHPKRRPAYMY